MDVPKNAPGAGSCGLWLSVWKKCSSGMLMSDIQSSRSRALRSVSAYFMNSRDAAMCADPLVIT